MFSIIVRVELPGFISPKPPKNFEEMVVFELTNKTNTMTKIKTTNKNKAFFIITKNYKYCHLPLDIVQIFHASEMLMGILDMSSTLEGSSKNAR